MSDTPSIKDELDRMSKKLKEMRESSTPSFAMRYKRDGDLATVKLEQSNPAPVPDKEQVEA